MNPIDNLNPFIQDQLDMRKRHYQENPPSIVEHFNIEQSNMEAYNGRQLLEMLQNADDACKNASNKKVLIQLIDNQLIIANNGEPFSKDGFESIINSNLSPKTMLQNQIGQKGLGFRSILSWANEVTIQSGTTSICFSPKIAQDFLEDLIIKTPNLSTVLKNKSKEKYPIATLRVPKLLIINDISEFTTIIKLQLKQAIVQDVQKQINNIVNKETMLFLNHIETIEIQSPERNVIFKKTVSNTVIQEDIENSLITICEQNPESDHSESRIWNVKRLIGTHQSKNYALAIAWNDDLADKLNTLFSFFKTEVRFPFPALVHGTFELTPDRNQLVNDTNGHNSFLVTKLVGLIMKVATEIADKQLTANYLPLEFLQIDFENIDHIFKTFKFKEQLLERIKQSELFPSVNKNYFTYSKKPVYYDYPVAIFLRGIDVSYLMPVCENEKLVKFLKPLIYHYTIDSFISILVRRINTISVEDLSKLFYHLLTHADYKKSLNGDKFVFSNEMRCLIDDNNQLIESEHVFIYPPQTSEFTLPSELNVRFVNRLLVKHLLETFGEKEHEIDFLVEQLKPFKVKKYDFIEVAKTLIQTYKNREQNEANIKELHQYLFGLYQNEVHLPTIDKEKDKELLTIPIITLNNTIEPASNIYFGAAYGHDLTEKLYDFDKSKIIALPQVYDFEADKEVLKKYFKWIGIAELPRYTIKEIKTNKNDPFFQLNLKHLKYPCLFYGEPYNYNNYKDLENWINREVTMNVGEFDQLEKIFMSISITTIFRWINEDKNLKETLEKDKEILSDNKLNFYIEKKRSATNVPKNNVLSYTKWQFANHFLLPVESDAKKAFPNKCCLSKTISNNFSPFIEKPKIDFTRIAKSTNIPEATLENYLVFMGVHREIKTFSTAILYEMLLELPTKDKDGKIAKSIYNEIVRNFDDTKLDRDDSNYQKYHSEGRILCQTGNSFDYKPISQAYYIDTKLWGSNLRKRFPLAYIDKKRGAAKIKKLFGVQPLDKILFKIPKEPKLDLHALNDAFQTDIRQFKPFIYTLRIQEDTKLELKRALDNLNIQLVQRILPQFNHGSQESPFEMEAFEFIPVEKRFYIYVPETMDKLDKLKQKLAFCNSIAEIFTLLLGVETYRDFIPDFYPMNEMRREERLLNYLHEDTNDILQKAKQALNIIDDIQSSFWRAFAIAFGMELDNDFNINTFLEKKLQIESEQEQIVLAECIKRLDNTENQKIIYDLFLKFNIDNETFLRHFSMLDWADFFKESFANMKNQYLNDFSWLLYEQLTKKANEQDLYFKRIKEYEAIEYEAKDGFLKDIEQTFKTKVQKLFNIELQDKSNTFSYKEKISNRIEELCVPKGLIERIHLQVLLLFDKKEEVRKLINEYEIKIENNRKPVIDPKLSISIRGVDISFKPDGYKELGEQYLDKLNISALKLETRTTLPLELDRSIVSSRSSENKVRNVNFGKGMEEYVGFIAELLTYKKLCKEYGESNVNWISENAFRFDCVKFPTSEAGKGYDMELTINKKIRYIEVKSCKNVSIGIKMSKMEMTVALANSNIYDLMIVENLSSNDPILRHIKSAFKFNMSTQPPQTLFTNDKFTVSNDNYLIQFNWKQIGI